jgi:hypothetical protein
MSGHSGHSGHLFFCPFIMLIVMVRITSAQCPLMSAQCPLMSAHVRSLPSCGLSLARQSKRGHVRSSAHHDTLPRAPTTVTTPYH